MDLYPRQVTIRGQKGRWGSCSSRGALSLNWKLISAPAFVLDYVVIHELAHLAHMNHSAAFWRLVAAHCPDYKRARRWLDDHQIELNWFHNGADLEN